MSRARILQERLESLGYDGNCRQNIKELQSLLEPAIDDLLDDFYQFMLERPQSRELLPTQEAIAHARNTQKQQWLELLFADTLDTAHCERAVQIGRVHERIGLTLSHYLGAYCVVLGRFVDLVAAKYVNDGLGLGEKVKSIQKAVFLDIDFVIDSYVEAKNSAIRKILQTAEQLIGEIEQIDGELAGGARRLEAGMDKLSQALARGSEQMELLRKRPEGEGTEEHLPALDELQAALAAVQESAKHLGEESKFLTSKLDRLSAAINNRKTRHRFEATTNSQEGFAARLRKAARLLFPPQPHANRP